ncbi:hypothetical protein F5J12DRAFT_777028 [Pisolithus orientalis]|uniref:uncharacterized protein n=1 Tax=Pisolithus orientalis TaxID=936130 RepID=UPI002224F03D|nr:uncharacterized protein F5J12DRAFT_777028 [Pisolithus orientalis]KAI5981794.1 hypothetical protein F5J12DRAFT_777028 [Pisolithus orientalis]
MDLVLQRILSCSKEYLGRIPPSRHFVRPGNERVLPISLPEPPSLLSALVNAGAPTALAEEMQQAYQQRASELKHHYETAALQVALSTSRHSGPSTSPSLESELFTTIKELYTTKLEGWLRDGLSLYKSHTVINSGQNDRPHRGRGTHVTFNIEYVPLLERFFDENPFPTHADKVFLAKKSGMTYRQIHVWFQNKRKRTRSRKEGKFLLKKPLLDGTTLSQGTPCDQVKQHLKRNEVCNRLSTLRGEAIDPFDAPAPPHAFPSTYPPPPRCEPFLENSVLQSHLLPWQRRPSPVRSSPLEVMSMSGLMEIFSKLSVRDDHGRQCQQTRPAHTLEIGAAVASITVKPFAAPLFATCRTAGFTTKPPLILLPSVLAPRDRLRPFRTLSPRSRPVTLIQPSLQAPFKGGRKIAPLPKRVPQTSTRNLPHSTPDSLGRHRPSSGSSMRSSSSESSSPAATTPEAVSSPLPQPVELSTFREPLPSIGLDDFNDLAKHPLKDLRLDPSPALHSTPNVISQFLISQDNHTIMQAMQKTVSPPHTRLPLRIRP